MPGRLSRRRIADYIADGLIAGTPTKKQLLHQLAGFLIDTQRTKEVELIVRDIEFALSQKGVVQATIVSAFELTTEINAMIEAFVKTETNATQVNLFNSVAPDVIGGIKIAVPGRELDQTVARQLTVLKTRFKKA